MQPVRIPIDSKVAADAAWYAWHVCEASFRRGFKSRFGNGGLVKHMQGKLGEFAFLLFCRKNMIPVLHDPFRKDYSELDEYDDFVVEILGVRKIVEVKTQTIKNALNPDEKLRLYYNKSQYNSKKSHDYIVVFVALNPEWTGVSLLGWIHASEIKKFPVWSRNMKSPAYAIPIRALKPMKMFLEG